MMMMMMMMVVVVVVVVVIIIIIKVRAYYLSIVSIYFKFVGYNLKVSHSCHVCNC
jgi:hypothetical protein